MRSPDPAVVVRVGPVAIGIKIFAAPNIAVVILRVVTKPLGEETLAVTDPVVPGVCSVGRDELPVTIIGAFDDELGSTPIAQLEAGSFGIDPRAATIASAQAHASVARHVDAIEAFFLCGKRGLGRVNFKVLMIAIKLCEPDRSCALNDAQRYAFIAQRHDFQHGISAEPHEVAGVDLQLDSRVAIG